MSHRVVRARGSSEDSSKQKLYWAYDEYMQFPLRNRQFKLHTQGSLSRDNILHTFCQRSTYARQLEENLNIVPVKTLSSATTLSLSTYLLTLFEQCRSVLVWSCTVNTYKRAHPCMYRLISNHLKQFWLSYIASRTTLNEYVQTKLIHNTF